MRLPAAPSGAWPAIAATIAVLWLLWFFFPQYPVMAFFLAPVFLLIISLMIGKRDIQNNQHHTQVKYEYGLPPGENRGPVLLVCGDLGEDMFNGQPQRSAAWGRYIHAGDVSHLKRFTAALIEQFPHFGGQLSILFCCSPDAHLDKEALRASLRMLRQQIVSLNSLTGSSLPVIISGYFAGPATPWVMARGHTPMVYPEHMPAMRLNEWQQARANAAITPFLRQAYGLIQDVMLDTLVQDDPLFPPVHPFAITLRGGAACHGHPSVWALWLYRLTCLRLVAFDGALTPPDYFPDQVLPLLAPYARPALSKGYSMYGVFILALCALTALSTSIANNRQLIMQTSADLKRWYALERNHHGAKTRALNALQQDALLLERWQRQGEPLRYGLGLYAGERLWLAIRQAIDSQVPSLPAPSPAPVLRPAKTPAAAQTILLGNSALFDTGKWSLTAESAALLDNTLSGIEARAGWLILVAGHTDSTGSPQLNQLLSLKRAQAVRDWLLKTKNLSPACIAVQGYGASQPIAADDTPEHRAANRRVEISLIPQTDACQTRTEGAPANADSAVLSRGKPQKNP